MYKSGNFGEKFQNMELNKLVIDTALARQDQYKCIPSLTVKRTLHGQIKEIEFKAVAHTALLDLLCHVS